MKHKIYINDKLLKNEITPKELLNKFIFFCKDNRIYYIQYKYSLLFCAEQPTSYDKIMRNIYNVAMPLDILKLNAKYKRYDIFIL